MLERPPRSLGGKRDERDFEPSTPQRQFVQGLLIAVGVRTFGFRKRLEPVGDLVEALGARILGHARIHVGIFVRLARDRAREIGLGRADRQAGRRVSDHFEIFEMAVRVAGLAFRRRSEQGGDIGIAFDIGLVGEIEIAAIGLRLAGEGVLEMLLGFRTFERHGFTPFVFGRCAVWLATFAAPVHMDSVAAAALAPTG